jgi:hypothetical protein
MEGGKQIRRDLFVCVEKISCSEDKVICTRTNVEVRREGWEDSRR